MVFPGIISPAGPDLWKAALLLQLVAWLLFFVMIAANHARVHRRRKQRGGDRGPDFRAPASMFGLAIEGAAFGVVWSFRRPRPEDLSAGWILLALALAAGALALLGWAMRHLGRHWRIKAVVTADHELITSGPFRIVRHPVFASMLSMLAANAIVISELWAGLSAAVIYLAGTEIRVRAEDALLARRFPETFEAYRSKVPAYLPFVR